jgi:hypothetical protein
MHYKVRLVPAVADDWLLILGAADTSIEAYIEGADDVQMMLNSTILDLDELAAIITFIRLGTCCSAATLLISTARD